MGGHVRPTMLNNPKNCLQAAKSYDGTFSLPTLNQAICYSISKVSYHSINDKEFNLVDQ